MTRVRDSPTVLWQFRKEGARYTCALRLTPAGLLIRRDGGLGRVRVTRWAPGGGFLKEPT